MPGIPIQGTYEKDPFEVLMKDFLGPGSGGGFCGEKVEAVPIRQEINGGASLGTSVQPVDDHDVHKGSREGGRIMAQVGTKDRARITGGPQGRGGRGYTGHQEAPMGGGWKGEG